ncbi:hypothetical protein [Amycolatopsis pithecellobii]|uniref:Cupin domain-containing protein n=1 Tax=Amycolatopsis pithecellobii TaxID=664692 RepID=A0A6N7YKP9_9PSEU|nr:hypothetical protein [Amycolatopsis pithecellobii]MTD52592.1 hypothetical protein [Amycolatopsis pithecellobii]
MSAAIATANFPAAPPLPPPTSDMVMATPDMFRAELPGSFRTLPGFDASEIRESDLGALAAGDARVTIMRSKPGYKWVGSPWHMHHFGYSVTYIIKGWADFEFEGIGAVRLGAGTVMHQPAMNRHREGEASEDFEGVVFHAPKVFGTTVFLYDEEAGLYREHYSAAVADDEEFGKSLAVEKS